MAKGANLFIAYPQGGLEKRTTEQQTVYKQELAANKHLFDTTLNCSEIPEELIGATYIFTLKSGQEYALQSK